MNTIDTIKSKLEVITGEELAYIEPDTKDYSIFYDTKQRFFITDLNGEILSSITGEVRSEIMREEPHYSLLFTDEFDGVRLLNIGLDYLNRSVKDFESHGRKHIALLEEDGWHLKKRGSDKITLEGFQDITRLLHKDDKVSFSCTCKKENLKWVYDENLNRVSKGYAAMKLSIKHFTLYCLDALNNTWYEVDAITGEERGKISGEIQDVFVRHDIPY